MSQGRAYVNSFGSQIACGSVQSRFRSYGPTDTAHIRRSDPHISTFRPPACHVRPPHNHRLSTPCNVHGYPQSVDVQRHRLELNNWPTRNTEIPRLAWNRWKEGPDHQPIWSVVCLSVTHFRPLCLFHSNLWSAVDGEHYGSGRGRSLNLARERAACMAFHRLVFVHSLGMSQRHFERNDSGIWVAKVSAQSIPRPLSTRVLRYVLTLLRL